VVKKLRGRAHSTIKRAPKNKKPQINEEEEQILQKAAIYCLHTFPMLWTVGGIREERSEGSRRWVVAVYLRYPTGHEGYLGDLQFDGKEFLLLAWTLVVPRRRPSGPALAQWAARRRPENQGKTPVCKPYRREALALLVGPVNSRASAATWSRSSSSSAAMKSESMRSREPDFQRPNFTA
jgi:hypothetical protein